VASKLGREYVGVDISEKQIEANREQATAICAENIPTWHVGDSRKIETICPDVQADMIFTCPPYGDLEKYSDDPADISNMEYTDFIAGYRSAIKQSCTLLKDNRFAVAVVGEFRDKKGNYRNFVGDTVHAFRDAGLEYYNEAILVTAVGSLPIRAGKQFTSGRKLGKTHQNVLVFVKGDGRSATQACGDVAISFSLPTEQVA
jgi:DNA modification methylase